MLSSDHDFVKSILSVVYFVVGEYWREPQSKQKNSSCHGSAVSVSPEEVMHLIDFITLLSMH